MSTDLGRSKRSSKQQRNEENLGQKGERKHGMMNKLKEGEISTIGNDKVNDDQNPKKSQRLEAPSQLRSYVKLEAITKFDCLAHRRNRPYLNPEI